MMFRRYKRTGRLIVIAFCIALTIWISGEALAQSGGLLSGGPRHSVVIENGSPAIQFVSRDGSVSLVYFRKHGVDDAFVVNVMDWDNWKIKTGLMYFTAKRIIFESDESERRGFDVAKDEAKLKIQKGGMRFFVVKIAGKEKRFMVSFSPPLPTPWGKHQDPVFELIDRIINDYEGAVSELQKEAAKLVRPIDERQPGAASAASPNTPMGDTKVVIEITSEPSGAEIYVDGAFAGSTPSKLSLKIGEHLIDVIRPGFKEWQKRILLDAESAKSVNAILEKKEP